MNFLDNYFKLSANGTNVRTEVLAGFTTFLTMAYIIFVNPSILGDAGMPKDAVFVATCVAAAIGTLIMGLYANFPIGLAPGMGLNAYFAYGVVKGMGFAWEAALGAVFISGCCFLLVSLLRIREKIMNAIPPSLRTAIPAGVGLFLALISLKNAGIVVSNPATFVTMGDLHQPAPVLAIIGFMVIVALDRLRVTGALLIGIMTVTVLSFFFGGNQFHGIVSAPPSIQATALKLDVVAAVSHGLLNVVLVFFLVELFDATGTLMGVAQRAGLMKDGKMPAAMNKALLADSGAIIAGSLMGTSSTTAFIESAAGVQAGGRTGLTAVTIAVLFLLALFIAPLAGVVPAYATAPALFFVACLMLRELTEVNWAETTESIPAVVTALVMPFTYSIANGLALGFISYAGLKLLTGKHREVSYMLWGIAGIFLFKTIYLPG